MSEPEATTHVTSEGGWTVLVLADDLKHINETKVAEGREALNRAVEIALNEPPHKLLIDMTGCAFFGSSFIEALFQTWKRLEKDEGQFAVCGCNKDIREVFQVTRLEDVWSIFETRDEAVASS